MDSMRFRLGLMVGMGAGYVLGAKAGQERYEEIRERFNTLMGTEQAQQLQSQVRDVAHKTGAVVGEKANDTVAKVSQKVGSAGSETDEVKVGGDPADVGIVLPPT
jgi:tryptophan synthase beta subunit